MNGKENVIVGKVKNWTHLLTRAFMDNTAKLLNMGCRFEIVSSLQ
jgi:hypothetical protein